MNYNALYNKYWSQDDRHGHMSCDLRQLAATFARYGAHGKYLDIGCGEGWLVCELIELGLNAVGIDISEVALAEASKKLPGHFFHGDVTALPFADKSFDTVVSSDCLEHLTPGDVRLALKEIHRVTKRFAILQVATEPDRENRYHLTVEKRHWWETLCFELGFRKHPNYYDILSLDSLNKDGWQIIIPLEKVPERASQKYPLEYLKKEIDFRMDMLRASGRCSDAHCIRYHHAAEYIREGDRVLDLACGYGYGSKILLENSKALSVIGIDNSKDSIHYAVENYAAKDLQYLEGDAEALHQFPNNSIDFVTGFEMIEYLPHPEICLKEIHRILTPGGRVMLSAQNMKVNKQCVEHIHKHLHMYTWEKFKAQTKLQGFLLEKYFNQTAGIVQNNPNNTSQFYEAPYAEELPESEWMCVLAMKDPLLGRDLEYCETRWLLPNTSEFHVAAFARDYLNPYLLKGMITIGQRMTEPFQLQKIQKIVFETYPTDSVDYGAALCGLLYSEMGLKNHVVPENALLEAVAAYTSAGNVIPHRLRWQVSCLYAAGLLAQKYGLQEQADAFWEQCLAYDVAIYSPLLGTKIADAAFALAVSYLTRDIERAKTLLFRSLQEIERITKSDWLNVRGLPEFPLGFGYAEMAQLLDKGARAAYLLTVLRESPERLEIIRRESYGFLERQIIAQQERANQLDETSRQKAQEGLALSEQNERLAEECKGLYTKNVELAEECQRLDASGQALVNRIAALELALQNLRDVNEQNERLAEECKGLYTKNVELAEECQRLDASGQALVNRIAALEQTLQELQNTEKARRQLILDRIDEYISTIRDITTSFSMKMAKVLQTVRHYRILGYSTPCSAITDVIYSIFSRRPLASNFGLLKATQDFWQDTISRYDALTPLTEEKVDIILQVDNFLNGGLENVVIEQACFFREQGKKVSILVLQQAGNSVLLAEGKHIHVICRRYTEDAYADLMRRLAPSAVFAHCSYNGAAICASLSIPFIQVVHNTYIWTRTYPECRQPILDAMPYTTKIVCVSELVRYFFNKEYQADNRKLVVIPNGIDLQRFRFSQRARVDIRNRYGIAPGTVLFLSVGSISEQKNYPAMIRALALTLREAPNAKLLIIGHNYDQGIYEQMMAFAQENHIQDSIIYAGLVQNTEDYYAAADILLQSSFYEGCSLTILEGLACLCPFVAAATGTLALLDTIPRCHIVPTQIPLAELTMSRLHEKSDMFDRQFADAMIRAYKECDFSRLNISSEVREMFDQNLTYKQYLILLDTLLRHGDTQEFKNTSPLNWVDMIGTRRDCDLV